jgi:hypothetical protein
MPAWPDPGFGKAYTWTESTPVPLTAPRSIDQPDTSNGCATLALFSGVSTAVRTFGCAAAIRTGPVEYAPRALMPSLTTP